MDRNLKGDSHELMQGCSAICEFVAAWEKGVLLELIAHIEIPVASGLRIAGCVIIVAVQ